MRRRSVIVLLGSAAAWPLAARAQQSARMRRIGVLTMAATPDSPLFRVFREELRKLGHIEGRLFRLNFAQAGAIRFGWQTSQRNWPDRPSR
jgi:hypothetical protein